MKSKLNPEMIDEENPEWTDEMFAKAELMTKVDPELVEMSKHDSKELLSIHYSPEVIKFFKSTGKGWQARMNEVLRNYVASHQISGEYH